MLNDLDLNLDLSLFDVKHGKGVSNRYCKPKKFKSVSQNRVKWCDAPNRDDVVYVDGVRCRVVAVVDDALVVVGLMGANV